MSAKNSHLTIREEVTEQGLAVPVSLLSLDGEDPLYIQDTPYLNIDCEYCSDHCLDDNGSNLLVKITDPTQFDGEGKPLKNRLAFAINADYDWN